MTRWTVSVRQTPQVIDGMMITGAPKTKTSRRAIPILEPAHEPLARWRMRQMEERLKAGPDWADSGLVFATREGKPLMARNVSRRFHDLLDRAGLNRRGMHALRHSTATLLLAAGVHMKVVQELLGHSQISLTLDTYSHVSQGQREQATAKLSALLTPPVGQTAASTGD